MRNITTLATASTSLLTVVFTGIFVAVALLDGGSPAAATTPTPQPTLIRTPTTVPVLLTFSEFRAELNGDNGDNGDHSDNADHSERLVFTLFTDGTARLDSESKQDADWLPIWTQIGRLTVQQAGQLTLLADQLTAFQGDYKVTQAADCSHYLLEMANRPTTTVMCKITADGVTAPVTLQSALQKLLEYRNPFETLVVFEWTGGLAGRNTVLDIHNDGHLYFNNIYKSVKSDLKVSQFQFTELRALLQSQEFTDFKLGIGGGCSDCWVYTVRAMTASGVKELTVSDTELSLPDADVPQRIKQLISVLKRLTPVS